MNRTLLALTVATFTTVSPQIQAQSAQEQLDSRLRAVAAMLDAQLGKDAVPGAALGVVHDQTLSWSYQFGVESLETGQPVTDDTLFSICSVSKLFNGIAAMSLVEDGRLDLDASIYDYLGDIAPADPVGMGEPVTLRNILSHVSGLPREGVDDFWAENAFPDAAALRASTEAHAQLYAPYDHWQYSNLGMALVGAAIEAVTGKGWGSYVDATVLGPLGMDTTTTDMPFDRVGNGFARGYYVRNGRGERKPVPEHQFRAYAPAAGIASSVNDLAGFVAWNFRLRADGGEEVISARTLREMQRVHWVGPEFNEPAWGLAYAARRYDDKTLWGHGGYCPGARTELVMRLPDETAYIMMVTANDVSPGALVKSVYGLVNDKLVAAVAESTADTAGAGDTDDMPAAEASVELGDYEGYYEVENYDWDAYIGIDDDSLFALPIFADDPAGDLEIYVHESGDRFRRRRDDGSLAEPVIFERDETGRVSAVVQHSYRSHRREDD